eukprot:131575_1
MTTVCHNRHETHIKKSYAGIKRIVLVCGYLKQCSNAYIPNEIMDLITIYFPLSTIIPTDITQLLSVINKIITNHHTFINIFFNYNNECDLSLFENIILTITKLVESMVNDNNKILLPIVTLITRFMELMFQCLTHNTPTYLHLGGNINDQKDFDTLPDFYSHVTIEDDNKYDHEIVPTDYKQLPEFQQYMFKKTFLQKPETVKQAVKLLCDKGPPYSNITYIAKYLHSNVSGLNQAKTGEFISSLETSVFSQTQHQELLIQYFQLLNFSDQTVGKAVRNFLCFSGFRLPKEAQKIDRLIEAFANKFVADNPSINYTYEQVLVLVYGILMISTELYVPIISKGKSIATPMSQSQTAFANMIQSGDTKIDDDTITELFQMQQQGLFL